MAECIASQLLYVMHASCFSKSKYLTKYEKCPNGPQSPLDVTVRLEEMDALPPTVTVAGFPSASINHGINGLIGALRTAYLIRGRSGILDRLLIWTTPLKSNFTIRANRNPIYRITLRLKSALHRENGEQRTCFEDVSNTCFLPPLI